MRKPSLMMLSMIPTPHNDQSMMKAHFPWLKVYLKVTTALFSPMGKLAVVRLTL